jgi:uncharacterized YigZ family protein
MPKMTQYSYRTIGKPSQGLFRDRGSKFLSFAWPAFNEDEIKDKLEFLRHKYHDARHHCYAWKLDETFRVNDDGEPSNTAGKPILGQIQKHDLNNILIVVVRYFGGTLLGTGGLINAYREAAADALANSEIITKTIDGVYDIRFPYSSLQMVMKLLSQEKVLMVDQDFSTICRIRVRIPLGISAIIAERLRRIENVNIENISGNYN